MEEEKESASKNDEEKESIGKTELEARRGGERESGENWSEKVKRRELR